MKEVKLDFGLHPRQLFALFSKATEILYGGAAGGGKSFLMRVAAIIWCAQIPGLQVYIFRRTFPELFKNHMEGPSGFPTLLADWVTAKFVTINYSNHTIRFWNGSVIFLCHCQHEKSVFGFKGAEIHVLMVDELTQFTATMYRFLRSRMRLGSLVLPEQFKGLFPRALNGTNPGDVGHNWVKAAFVDNGPGGQVVPMPNKEGGMRRQFVRAKLDDNPSVDREDYAGKLEGLGDPALVRAMLEGDWDIVAGGMFDDLWNRDKHVIKPFQIPSSWRIDRCFDWGSSAPFSVGWWAESDGTEATMADGTKRHFPRGTLIRIMEWYGWNGTPNEGLKYTNGQIARGIMEIERNMQWKVQPGPADSMIYNVEPGKKSIADEMAGERHVWTDAQGKRHEQYGPRFVPADKTPGSRKNGWERMRVLFYNVTHYPLEKPGLYVFDDCTQFIRTIPTLPRDEKNRDDVDTHSEDHCLIGSTLVDTLTGQVPIANLVGQQGFVFGSDGQLHWFENCRRTRENAETMRVHFEDGRSVVCTADHRFLTEKGWIEARHITDEAGYSIMPAWLQSSVQQFRNLQASDTIFAEITFSGKVNDCILKYGALLTELSRLDATCITKIMIEPTIKLITSNSYLSQITIGITGYCGEKKAARRSQNIGIKRISGMVAKPDVNGTDSIMNCIADQPWRELLQGSAKTAAMNSRAKTSQNSVQITANPRGVERAAQTSKSANVRFVEPDFRSTNTGRIKTALGDVVALRVVKVEPFGQFDVYCLDSPDLHDFSVEGGIIVHNCGDETRYRVLQTTRRLVGV